MLNDEEHIAIILEAQERYGLKDGGPSVSEYTPEVARLDMMIDIARQQAVQFARANGAKNVKMPRLQPRPETAIDVTQHRKKVEKSKHVADLFMHRKPYDQ